MWIDFVSLNTQQGHRTMNTTTTETPARKPGRPRKHPVGLIAVTIRITPEMAMELDAMNHESRQAAVVDCIGQVLSMAGR
jgi:hypothetical protein